MIIAFFLFLRDWQCYLTISQLKRIKQKPTWDLSGTSEHCVWAVDVVYGGEVVVVVVVVVVVAAAAAAVVVVELTTKGIECWALPTLKRTCFKSLNKHVSIIDLKYFIIHIINKKVPNSFFLRLPKILISWQLLLIFFYFKTHFDI